MMISFVSVVLILILGLLLYLALNQPDGSRMPPGPKGLPLIGCLHHLIGHDHTQYFKKLGDDYGPICSVQLGLRRVVVINSSFWLNQSFAKQGEMFNHRPRGHIMNLILQGRGIVDSEGPLWRDTRRFTLHTLRQFGMGKNIIEKYVQEEVDAFLIHAKVGEEYNPHYDIATSILNIVWHMIVGDRFQFGDKTLRWIIDSMEMSLSLVDQGSILNFTPMVQIPGVFLRPKALYVGLNVFYRLNKFRYIIHQHKKKVDDPTRGEDLIYNFILEQRKQQKESGQTVNSFTDEQLLWLISDLFIVSLDTTVTFIRWAVLIFTFYPEMQRKIQEEIDQVIGRDNTPLYENRTQMPYLEAFSNEVLRYASFVPRLLHSNPEDTQLGEWRIPKRTWVIANLYGIHHDKKVWGDPEVFRPERFFGKEGEALRSEHLMAFSVGRRNCLGESLARTEGFLFLTGILQKFNFTFPPGSKPSLAFNDGVTLNPVEFHVVLESRTSPTQKSG